MSRTISVPHVRTDIASSLISDLVHTLAMYLRGTTFQRTVVALLQGQQSTPEELEQQTEKANRSSSVEVLLVRSAEKALDAANNLLKPTAWNSQILSSEQALDVLQV